MHKYTRVARGREGVEIKSMIDLVLLKRDMLRYVQDVRAVRGMGGIRSQERKGRTERDIDAGGGGESLTLLLDGGTIV